MASTIGKELKAMQSTKERAKECAGRVWYSDAPDGYVALVVYASNGRRLLRIEIAKDVYATSWIGWLKRWLRRWDPAYLKLVE